MLHPSRWNSSPKPTEGPLDSKEEPIWVPGQACNHGDKLSYVIVVLGQSRLRVASHLVCLVWITESLSKLYPHMGMVEIYYLIWWISIHKTAILGYDSGTTSAPTSSGEKDLESSWTVRTIWSGRLLVEGQPLQLKENWYLWDCHHQHHHHHQSIYQSCCGLCLSIPEGFSLVRDYLPHKVWVVRVSTITLWAPRGSAWSFTQ